VAGIGDDSIAHPLRGHRRFRSAEIRRFLEAVPDAGVWAHHTSAGLGPLRRSRRAGDAPPSTEPAEHDPGRRTAGTESPGAKRPESGRLAPGLPGGLRWPSLGRSSWLPTERQSASCSTTRTG